MDLSNSPSRADPAYRKFHRACLAACMLLAPVVLILGFAVDPTGGVGVPASVNVVAAEFKAASPLQIQFFLWVNAVTVYFFPLSFIGLGLLAMRHSPWLATLGIILGLMGSLPFAFFVGPEELAASLGQLGVSAPVASVWQYARSQGVSNLLQWSWAAGHVLGYLFIGIALLRARVIPRWAAWLIIVSAPLMGPVAYPTHLNIVQILAFVLVFIGSIPAVLALLKMRGEPVARGEEPEPAT